MKRSHLTSLLGTLSLGLIISSCILSPYPTNIALIPLGLLFSIILIFAILGAYFGVRTSNFYYHYFIFYPITRFLFTSYSINSLVISLIAISVDISILGVMSEILWISSAVFGIVAAIVYRSDKQNHIVAGYTPPVIQETGGMQRSET